MSLKEKNRQLEAENAVLRWNATYPQEHGPWPVRFWTGVREGLGRYGYAYSAACILGGSAGVYIREHVEGCMMAQSRNVGFVSLSHVEPDKLLCIEDWLEGLADEQIGAWVHYCYRTEPLPKGVRPICIYRNKPLAELVDGDGVCNLRAYLYNHEFGGGGCYRIHVMPPGKGQRPNIANGNIRLPGAPKLIPAAANPALPDDLSSLEPYAGE